MGLLSYIIEGFDPETCRDVVFLPVAMNYDRVLEDRVLVAANVKGSRKFGLRFKYVARHVGKHLWQRITGRFHRFGYASVSFGSPLSLKEFAAQHERKMPETLARELMGRIRDVVPVLPVPVVAAVMLEKEIHSRDEITDRFQTLVADMESRGAHIHMPRNDLDYAVEVGLRLLLMRGLIVETAGQYRVNPPDRVVLGFYANSIAHLSEAITSVHISDLTPAEVADASRL